LFEPGAAVLATSQRPLSVSLYGFGCRSC